MSNIYNYLTLVLRTLYANTGGRYNLTFTHNVLSELSQTNNSEHIQFLASLLAALPTAVAQDARFASAFHGNFLAYE